MRNEIAIILLCGLVLVSCVKDLSSVEPEVEIMMPEKQITLTAIGEDGTSTKTVRDETDGSVWWTPGDAISVFSPANNKFVCNATENSRVASFSGTVPDTFSDEHYVVNQYSIGEIVYSSGRGVVAWISADGATALLISVSELQGKDWQTSNNWCSSYGEGWRMPTIDELTLIHNNFSTINAGLKSSGYTQLSTANKCYWSSTVNPANSSYYYRERLHDGTVFKNTGNDEKASSTANIARAIKIISRESQAPPSFIGLYPYDEKACLDGSSVTMNLTSRQTATAGTFANGLFPSLGRSDSLYMRFFNICGGIRFSIANEGIRSVMLKGNNGEELAGIIRVGFSDEGVPEVKEVIEGAEEIILEAPDNSTFEIGKNYYIVLLPTVFTRGFSLTFFTHTNISYYNRKVATEIKRSVFSGLSNVDANLVYSNYQAVDLGLSVMWATCNVGAAKPEDYGDYFAWGETETYYEPGYAQSASPIWKKDKNEYGYEWPTYKWGSGNNNYKGPFSKYNTQSDFGTIDNRTVLELDDDAAYVNWGECWRMPTQQELNELKFERNCKWEWTSINGVAGVKITSIKIGYKNRWIFLPASGTRIGTNIIGLGESGSIWSSSLRENLPSNVYDLNYNRSSTISNENNNARCNGRSVRPVYCGPIPDNVYGISISQTSISMRLGDTYSLTATVVPNIGTVNWSSSDITVARVDQNGLVSASGPGQAIIEATTSKGENSASCMVTVINETYLPPIGEAVDLGLSVKWASFNLGAEKPEDYGDYFAWGETKPKTTYVWSTYKWCNGSILTKYNTKSSKGTVDNKTVLDPEDDAAHVNWGGNWRMPTYDEWVELIKNCTVTWITQYGRKIGCVVTGPNGNSIFLPFAGFKMDYGLQKSNGDYWSSSISTYDTQSAYDFDFLSDPVYWGTGPRYYGEPIRPVHPKD